MLSQGRPTGLPNTARECDTCGVVAIFTRPARRNYVAILEGTGMRGVLEEGSGFIAIRHPP